MVCPQSRQPFIDEAARRDLANGQRGMASGEWRLDCGVPIWHAAFFHRHGLPREDVSYVTHTFHVNKQTDTNAYRGRYQIKESILDATTPWPTTSRPAIPTTQSSTRRPLTGGLQSARNARKVQSHTVDQRIFGCKLITFLIICIRFFLMRMRIMTEAEV